MKSSMTFIQGKGSIQIDTWLILLYMFKWPQYSFKFLGINEFLFALKKIQNWSYESPKAIHNLWMLYIHWERIHVIMLLCLISWIWIKFTLPIVCTYYTYPLFRNTSICTSVSDYCIIFLYFYLPFQEQSSHKYWDRSVNRHHFING